MRYTRIFNPTEARPTRGVWFRTLDLVRGCTEAEPERSASIGHSRARPDKGIAKALLSRAQRQRTWALGIAAGGQTSATSPRARLDRRSRTNALVNRAKRAAMLRVSAAPRVAAIAVNAGRDGGQRTQQQAVNCAGHAAQKQAFLDHVSPRCTACNPTCSGANF